MYIPDPYVGVPYSMIVARNPREYHERPRPLKRVPGTGRATWDTTSGNWVV